MIDKFYEKINTIFDGLENDQKVTVYNQLGAKLMAADLLPKTKASWSPTGKTGNRFKKPGYVSFKHVTGYDPKKPAIARIEGTMVKDFNTVDEHELILIMKDKKYTVCERDDLDCAKFEGDNHNCLKALSPHFNSNDTSKNWRALNDWVKDHYS